ncbi:MAG: hypothetical protein NTV51_07400 [Verrucomicrobia bacterium]|nr:hypothetical protein [Verrucomicrobiota bacterium]
MKRVLQVLGLGLVCGVVAHLAWFGARRPEGGADLGSQLAWMRETLELTPEQFARIKALHEESGPRLLALAAQVAQMRGEFAAFERERRTTGQIDFVEFARFVEQRRAVDRECAESTRRLILAASEVLSPRQRETYLGLLDPARRSAGPPPVN